jgi:SAM-dependent methyltransferase
MESENMNIRSIYMKFLSYLTRFENKIYRFILPIRLYTRYAWNKEQFAAAWYKNDFTMKSENLSRSEYLPFFETLGNVLNGENTLGIDLGCGMFRVTKALLEKFSNSNYLGIDFSIYAMYAYKELSIKYNNVDFVQADLINVDLWRAYIIEKYNKYMIAAYSFGVLEYLNDSELRKVLHVLYNLNGFNCICCIEPTGGLNLELITSVKAGTNYFHNYPMYLKETGFKIKYYSCFFQNQYALIIAYK